MSDTSLPQWIDARIETNPTPPIRLELPLGDGIFVILERSYGNWTALITGTYVDVEADSVESAKAKALELVEARAKLSLESVQDYRRRLATF